MQAQDSSDPTGVVANSNSPAVLTARQRKTQAALQLKLAGASWDEIAQVVGYPTPRQALVAVEKALQLELKNDPKAQARMRALAGVRLERLLRGTWAKAIDESHPEHLQAVSKARDIIDRYAKLFGLDAPTEVTFHTPTRDALEAWVGEALNAKMPALEEADIFDVELLDEVDEDAS